MDLRDVPMVSVGSCRRDAADVGLGFVCSRRKPTFLGPCYGFYRVYGLGLLLYIIPCTGRLSGPREGVGFSGLRSANSPLGRLSL